MCPPETTVWTPFENTSIIRDPNCLKIMAPSISPLASNTTPNHSSGGATESKRAYTRELISNALQERIDNIDSDNCEPGGEDAFFIGDLGEIYRQHMRWKRNLPRVEPFYGP